MVKTKVAASTWGTEFTAWRLDPAPLGQGWHPRWWGRIPRGYCRQGLRRPRWMPKPSAVVIDSLDVWQCYASDRVSSGSVWLGWRGWPTELCGCCMQPMRQCPSKRASRGWQDSGDGSAGWQGVWLLGPAFVLEGSWAKALATATPVGTASLFVASCFSSNTVIQG